VTKAFGEEVLGAKMSRSDYFQAEVIHLQPPAAEHGLGWMVLKSWTPEGASPFEGNIEHLSVRVEGEILELAFRGMHVEGAWYELDTGLFYIDTITAVLPSFYIEPDSAETDDSSDGF